MIPRLGGDTGTRGSGLFLWFISNLVPGLLSSVSDCVEFIYNVMEGRNTTKNTVGVNITR